MKPTAGLAIFTNCTNDILKDPTIFKTLESYFDVLKPNHTTVQIFCDPAPNPRYLPKYLKRLQELGIGIKVTKGLADGYRQALDFDTDYVYMLEHDWQFLAENIHHTLDEIIAIMERDNLWYMNFNRLFNDDSINDTKWQTYMNPATDEYCLTDRVSNNPHIINRKYYLENIANRVDWKLRGAGRIEQVLQKNGLEVAEYGAYGSPPTIKHLNGRKGGKK